jgi:hypothetical protein
VDAFRSNLFIGLLHRRHDYCTAETALFFPRRVVQDIVLFWPASARCPFSATHVAISHKSALTLIKPDRKWA